MPGHGHTISSIERTPHVTCHVATLNSKSLPRLSVLRQICYHCRVPGERGSWGWRRSREGSLGSSHQGQSLCILTAASSAPQGLYFVALGTSTLCAARSRS